MTNNVVNLYLILPPPHPMSSSWNESRIDHIIAHSKQRSHVPLSFTTGPCRTCCHSPTPSSAQSEPRKCARACLAAGAAASALHCFSTNRREKRHRGAVIEPQIRLHPYTGNLLREIIFFLNFACSRLNVLPQNTEIHFRKYFRQGGAVFGSQPTF